MQRISKFSEADLNSTVRIQALVTSITESNSKAGSPYCRITLSDGESIITANMFSTSMQGLFDNFAVEQYTVVITTLSVSEYNGTKSFKIQEIQRSADQDTASFIRVPPVPSDVMKSYILNSILNSAPSGMDSSLVRISHTLISNHCNMFCRSSAAVSMHHNLLGGLLYHTYRMVQAAEKMCEVYDTLDKELLICGTALHDIAKIYEYNTSPVGDATVSPEGVLFGHLYMGAEMVHDAAVHFNCAHDERVLLLQHMIVSHHGQQEWGAVVAPAIPEAFVLHYIDNIDAKLYMCEELTKDLENGQVTEKRPFGLENRLYRR